VREILFDPVGVGIDDFLEVASLVGYDPFWVIAVDSEGVNYYSLKKQLLLRPRWGRIFFYSLNGIFAVLITFNRST
jgi:hypothetical protein